MNIKNNLKFIIAFILFIFIINFLSNKYLMANFLEIEKESNNQSIHNILNTVDQHLKSIESIALDYAQWDDTYDFIKEIKNNYIYENFREGSSTLEDLNLDFILFTSENNEIKFSVFNKKHNLENRNNIIKDIRKNFSNRSPFTSVYKNGNNFNFLITKALIKNSDQSKKTDSFIYIGKLINLKLLNKVEESFNHIEIKDKKITSNIKNKSQYLQNIQIETINNKDFSFNTIAFYNYKNEYIFSIFTQKHRKLIQKGKDTIFTYNLTISGFLFFIFLLIYRHQKLLENYNKRMERTVHKKTKHLKSINKKLRILSQTDELTEINNRRNFFTLGTKILRKCMKQDIDFSILMIDIDNFKKINDSYGHSIGDQVLIHISKTVKDIIGKEHIFGRLGGEEFALILVDTNEDESYKITELIRKTINDSIIEINNITIKYTISIGLAKRENNTSIDMILKEADTLLYSAKSRGKNRIIRNIDN